MLPNQKYTFEAEIEEDKRSVVCINLPFNASEVYGTKGQIKVKAKINDYEFRGSLFPMGGYHVLLLRKRILQTIGKRVGDKVNIEFEQDFDERIVEIPKELAEAFEVEEEAKLVFDKFCYSHRRELVDWINDAKRAETKINRIVKFINTLLLKRKNK